MNLGKLERPLLKEGFDFAIDILGEGKVERFDCVGSNVIE